MRKILLIEDSKEVRENTAEILSLADFQVITAENGRMGVEYAKLQEPDLIICDIMMPELDGYGVLYTLSKNPKTATIPFIFLTAKADRSDVRKGMSLGADDYLVKPFDDQELIEAAESRLRKHDVLKQEFFGSKGYEQFVSTVKEMEDLQNLSEKGIMRTYRKKDTIYKEGQFARYLYLVHSGRVKTSRLNDDGKEYITGIYSKGNYFGYMHLFEDAAICECAEALEDTELYLIPKDDYLKLMYSNRQVAMRFVHLLTNDLSMNNERLLSLAYSSVRKRLAEALVFLTHKYAGAEAQTASFAFSRENLANVIGTSHETAIRVLSDFKDEGLIEVQGATIRVCNVKKLQSIQK